MKISSIIDKIIERIFEEMDYCGHCGKDECKDHSYRKLPNSLSTDKVLKILNELKKEDGEMI